jgi:hypothetical protein
MMPVMTEVVEDVEDDCHEVIVDADVANIVSYILVA